MTKLYDITRTITPDLPVWPGDTPVSIEATMTISQGDIANVSRVVFTTHLGTHVDAPYHFVNDGLTLEKIPLEIYIGPVTVVTVHKKEGPLYPADFPQINWATVKRLIIHSSASHKPLDYFNKDYVYPSPTLADLMGEHGVILFGTDAPSVDNFNSKDLVGHQALYRNKIFILEGLWLPEVPDGEYNLIATPLKIAGGDGCPVRAILQK